MLSDCTKWARVPAHGGLVFVDEILSILKCRNVMLTQFKLFQRVQTPPTVGWHLWMKSS